MRRHFSGSTRGRRLASSQRPLLATPFLAEDPAVFATQHWSPDGLPRSRGRREFPLSALPVKICVCFISEQTSIEVPTYILYK